ncbi:hypothetical protein Pint_25255 [Pistacia integerrima]|uniref:Uncharacterized protein n=1 Tax=Pistacia integerrima TaxID=434235 RepID=A0ACC0YCN0_9ROSI|nr:hypothetical protein Pint_25255 [Pistacia integerrima]
MMYMNFYNKYAKEAGFSVRINSTNENKETNVIVRKKYVYFKEGTSMKGEVSEKKKKKRRVRG